MITKRSGKVLFITYFVTCKASTTLCNSCWHAFFGVSILKLYSRRHISSNGVTENLELFVQHVLPAMVRISLGRYSAHHYAALFTFAITMVTTTLVFHCCFTKAISIDLNSLFNARFMAIFRNEGLSYYATSRVCTSFASDLFPCVIAHFVLFFKKRKNKINK